MKRILLSSTLALVVTATAAFCQQSTPQQPTGDAPATQQPADQYSRRHHPFDAHKAAQHLGKRLNLTDDQTAKLEPILATRQQKITSLRSDTSLTPDQRREQFRAIHKDTQTQFATVLTPDQMQQLQSMRSHGRRQSRQTGQQPDSTTTAPTS